MSRTLACAAELITPPADPMAVLRELGPTLAAQEEASDAAGLAARDNLELLRDAGFTALAVPAAFGGHGLAGRELGGALSDLGGHCGATALALAMHTHQVAIAAWRWKVQGAPVGALLERIATERLWILSTGGADWLDGSGTAVRVEGGFLVKAAKAFVSGAAVGNLLNTTAVHTTEDGQREVLHFTAPMTADGIRIESTWDTLGMRSSGSETVHLEDVFVADSAVSVRRPAGRWHPALHVVTMIALPLVYSVYVGVAKALRNRIVARLRVSPNGARASGPLGSLDNELRVAELAHADMLAAMESNTPGVETTHRVMTGRVIVARSLRKVADQALDVGGGAGFYRATGIERSFRDLQASRYHPLQEHVQSEFAGRLALGLEP